MGKSLFLKFTKIKIILSIFWRLKRRKIKIKRPIRVQCHMDSNILMSQYPPIHPCSTPFPFWGLYLNPCLVSVPASQDLWQCGPFCHSGCGNLFFSWTVILNIHEEVGSMTPLLPQNLNIHTYNSMVFSFNPCPPSERSQSLFWPRGDNEL
jgi:hypothetical protein